MGGEPRTATLTFTQLLSSETMALSVSSFQVVHLLALPLGFVSFNMQCPKLLNTNSDLGCGVCMFVYACMFVCSVGLSVWLFVV